jgi:hypothetical protein
MASNHRSRGQEGPAGPISRPAEGDDQESAASTFAPLEVEQVLLQHPDIVQAFVVGIPEIVARGSRAAGPGRATDPLARRDLPDRRGAAPGDRGSCVRRAKSKPRRYLVAYQPLTAEVDDCRGIPSRSVKARLPPGTLLVVDELFGYSV